MDPALRSRRRPLYRLLKKGRRFEWLDEHTESVRKLKEALAATPTLRKAVYEKGTPVYITVEAYRFFLRDGYLWKHPKKRNGVPLRVVAMKEDQEELLKAHHDRLWAGHRGTWATFEKLKGKYWWPGLYRDVHRFVTTCESCQMHSTVRHRDELHPTYPPTIHFKWMVDLVTMPMGVGKFANYTNFI